VLKRLNKPDLRYERRMARIARWDRPIATRMERIKAWAHMVFSDHGIFRLLYLNKHRVTDQFWRAAQPAPHQLAQLKQEGIRTIVNLRGGREHGSWQLQKEACDQLGLNLVDFVVRSRGAPERETVLHVKDFFDQLEYPVLVHCKSGADRAGFMSALYLIIHKGCTVAEAMQQLSFTYGHFRFAKTGILDSFLEAYEREGEAKGLSLLTWAATIYDPEQLQQDFKTGAFSSLLIDRVMRRE
jgi:protein tyrosine/serine phosphatase